MRSSSTPISTIRLPVSTFEAPPVVPLPATESVSPNPQMEQFQQFVAGKIGNQTWLKGKKLQVAPEDPNVLISEKSGQRFNVGSLADVEKLWNEVMIISGGSGQLDYYGVLGLDKTADAGQIKKAYRKLARENHPDATKGLPEAERKKREEKFKEINAAFEVLSNPDRRKAYDDMGKIQWGDAETGQATVNSYYPTQLYEVMRTHGILSNMVIVDHGERRGWWYVEGKDARYINPNTPDGEAELIRIITGEGNVQRQTAPQDTQAGPSGPETQQAQIVANLGKSWELLTGNTFGVAPKKIGIQTIRREVRQDGGNLLKIALIRLDAGDKVVELPFLPQEMNDLPGFTRRLTAFSYFLQGWGLPDEYISVLNKIVGELVAKNLAGELKWRSER